MANEKIIEKIRNLLELGKDQNSEHEAAQAMEFAAKLMAKHGIEKDQINERKAAVGEGEDIQSKRQFQVILSAAVAQLFAVRVVHNSQDKIIRFVGRAENVSAAELTFSWICLQVEQLYKYSLPKGLTQTERRRYRDSFKLACANRLNQRCAEIANQPPEGTSQNALVVHRSGLLKETDEYMVTRYKTKKMKASRYSDDQAAAAGRMAGDQVKLRGEID